VERQVVLEDQALEDQVLGDQVPGQVGDQVGDQAVVVEEEVVAVMAEGILVPTRHHLHLHLRHRHRHRPASR